jgi:hypothetical protein
VFGRSIRFSQLGFVQHGLTAGPVVAAVQSNPNNLGILNLVTRNPLAGNNGQELTTSLVTVLGFQVFGATDLLGRMHGHGFFDNENHVYTSALLPNSVRTCRRTGTSISCGSVAVVVSSTAEAADRRVHSCPLPTLA